ncbi:thioesterase [Moraxella ovis]|uniref:Acyl-CoA thioester hydrolase YbgC n=1 Tax=Moraxella ovis TaxID=29433 RepID=A0A378PQE2_9GAMM|nr:thioesterase family protein [Moraxella ovis]ANB91523.1 thioesterase [Moraxella ovis]STY87149.1 Acyl-CoA thioester hydrolase YbgC [Moraxella ovis]
MSTPIFHANYKVYINHTDAGGIVYHANHLTFFENCRRDWLTSLGFDGYFFDTDGMATGTDGHTGKVHFVVSRADLTYKSPLLVDDMIVVTVTDVVKKSASLILSQHIYRCDDDFKNGKIATAGVITLACVMNSEKGIRPHRLPTAFR